MSNICVLTLKCWIEKQDFKNPFLFFVGDRSLTCGTWNILRKFFILSKIGSLFIMGKLLIWCGFFPLPYSPGNTDLKST